MQVIDQLPTLDAAASETGCCALIDPAQWDDRIVEFDDKPFARTHTRNILHVPLDMGSKMRSAQELIDEAGAAPDGMLILSDDTSPWHTDHYIAVDRDVPGMEMTALSGRFYTKVFEGPYRNAGRWHDELLDAATVNGLTPQHTYFFYTACPNCAKAYGKNYVVGFERVE